MSDSRQVSFVIPVRNDAARLKACLASIAADGFDPAQVEVVVADNGSTDASAEVARAAGARVLPLPGLTVAELRNRAACAARGVVLAFVDADHEIAPGWTQCALESLDVPGVVAAGAPYDAPRNGTWVQRLYDTFRDHSAGASDVEWLGSGNLAVKREAFLAAGGFDTALVTCEDVDLCRQLRDGGGRILRDPRMRSTHHGDPATLRALFFGELWRGRDNLRASLRSRLSLRGVPSVAIPVLDLVLLTLAAAGLLGAAAGGLWLSASALVAIGMLAVPRVLVMTARLRRFTVVSAARALAVALTYDMARALASVWPVPHAARRRAEAR